MKMSLKTFRHTLVAAALALASTAALAELKAGGARVVPHAIVRKGSYIAPNVVLMPSYVNIGAHVGSGDLCPVQISDKAIIVVNAQDEVERSGQVGSLEDFASVDGQVLASHVLEHRLVVVVAITEPRRA